MVRMDVYSIIAVFIIVGLAASRIGEFFTGIRLPLITGFMFTGIFTGPFVLGMITGESLSVLGYANEAALGYIALEAGNRLFLKELRGRFKSIGWITIGLVVFTFTLGSFAVWLLADFIPFMRGMTPVGHFTVSILAGAILVARSPSSAIAIINELRARGPFTQTALGVTVVMDIAVIVIFSINSSIAGVLLAGLDFSPVFAVMVLAGLFSSLILGVLLCAVLWFVLSIRAPRIIKTVLILLSGYGIFHITPIVAEICHKRLRFELILEPLLICMVAGFLITNFSRFRNDFMKILSDAGPPVFVVFFTLTGASLRLDILAVAWPAALVLFFVRTAGIVAGSFVGGSVAGEPRRLNRISWMAFITQAGVGIGLSEQVAVQFPDWGGDFATVMVSVIILNQIVGPILFKRAIDAAGEAYPKAAPSAYGGPNRAVIFGLARQSITLARKLIAHDWRIKIVTLESDGLDKFEAPDLDIHHVPELSADYLDMLRLKKADALVALLSDEKNYRICEIAYERYGTKTMVARLNDRSNFERFHKLGALVVEPGTAFVSLLDHLVRSPSGASILLGMGNRQTIADVEALNQDLNGMFIRDIRLPLDTLIISVRRNNTAMISHGYTRIMTGDRLTVVGSKESLKKVMRQFGA